MEHVCRTLLAAAAFKNFKLSGPVKSEKVYYIFTSLQHFLKRIEANKNQLVLNRTAASLYLEIKSILSHLRNLLGVKKCINSKFLE